MSSCPCPDGSNPAPAALACPALLVSAPASGQGKTTLVAALARLWRRRGWRVQVFKCGPDFIDPGWHALASGQPVYQLDLWMVGEAHCRALLEQAALHNDVILVEGVMGLFDGEPSSADLAQRFGLPVLAVLDASATAGTLGALAYGLQHYRPGLPWAGVVANRVASASHAAMLRTSLREPASWLGAIARNPAFALPERHLGLLLTHELDDATARLDAAADALADTPLAALSLQDLKSLLPAPMGLQAEMVPASPVLRALLANQGPALHGHTIAVARDAACCFIYPANTETLQALGARVVFFSPLADAALPACDALWLPGGYPELHLAQLAQNTAMRESIRAHVAAGKPVWAECGGLMLLADSIAPADETAPPQAAWGVLPGTVKMHSRLQGLGPQALAIAGHADLPPLRGHTFHYSTLQTELPEMARTTSPRPHSRSKAGEAVYQTGPHGNVWASYFHPWFASSPQAAARLFLPRTQAPA